MKDFWLAAPKTTDALFLAPACIRKGLRLHLVGTVQHGGVTAVRAAALSAIFLIVNRAALELDIDPEEFDVIEPRMYRPENGDPVPLLQITDHLVNGAGFCERLAREEQGSGQAFIVRLVRSIVTDAGEYPLKDFLTASPGQTDHRTVCDQACYLCLHRYGNQMYHGLLDWRLGLSFLEVLNSADFTCGFDGTFDTPSLQDWRELAMSYAEQMVERFGGSGEVARSNTLPAFRLDRRKENWAIVVHPLWDENNPQGIVAEAHKEFMERGGQVRFVNTFDLARRQVKVREDLRKAWGR